MALQRLVMSCMAHAPAGRPSAAMLHQRLQGLLHTLGPHQHQPALREEQTTPREPPCLFAALRCAMPCSEGEGMHEAASPLPLCCTEVYRALI